MSAVKKFFIKMPMSNVVRYKLVSSLEKMQRDILYKSKLERIDNLSISKLYALYNETGDDKYFNEIYNKAYGLVDESEPTRQKIYRRFRTKNILTKEDKMIK